jgi:hypothetical protein
MLWLYPGSQMRTFIFGLLGVIFIDVISFYRIYESGQAIPRRYRKAGYWLVRLGVAIVSGGVAVISGANTDYIAFQIGMSTPLIITYLSSSARSKPEIARPNQGKLNTD